MRKIIHITTWFAGYLTCAGVIVVTLVLITPARVYPHLFEIGALEAFMADYSRRSFKYNVSQHDSSIVIVGPSYAAAVGEADGIYNLGLSSADLPQIINQVTQVKATDTPVCFLSIMDFVRMPADQSHPFNNRAAWFPYIIRGVDLSLSDVRPKPKWTTREAEKKIDADFIRRYEIRNLDDPAMINLKPLFEMRDIHSGIIFALAPIRLDNDTIADTHRALETALSRSDLRYVNLSHILDDDAFGDRYIFTKENREAVIAALRLKVPL